MTDKLAEVLILVGVTIAYFLKEAAIVPSSFFGVTAFGSVVILSTILYRKVTTSRSRDQEQQLWHNLNL